MLRPSRLTLLLPLLGLFACGGAPAEDTESTEDELRLAHYTCDYVSGGDESNNTGDGVPLRIRIAARDKWEFEAWLEDSYDFEHGTRGLPRDCRSIRETDGDAEIFACTNEFEWGYEDLTSTMRIPEGVLRSRRSFDLTYRAAEWDRRYRRGFREFEASTRLFHCTRGRR